MPEPILIPKATITLEEATLVSWLKSEGDPVTTDVVIFEMETDKALMEVPSPSDGVLLKILVPSGTVRVDQIVGWVGFAGEEIPSGEFMPVAPVAAAASAPVSDVAPDVESTVAADVAPTAAPTAAGRIRATPAARRVAKERGIELDRITGTGPEGRITQEDVERAAASDPGAPHPDTDRRKALIGKLSETWRKVPHIHIVRKIDAGPIEIQQAALRSTGTQASITDILLFTLARLLPKYTTLTAVWKGEMLASSDGVHLSLAVDTERGVVAPVIHDAGRLTIAQLTAERVRLSAAARAGRLSPADLEGGSFTLTNLGMSGVDFFAPVVNHPQTAILAAGRIVKEPVVEAGAITIGSRMWLNLTLDHRAADGALAARFLADFENQLAVSR